VEAVASAADSPSTSDPEVQEDETRYEVGHVGLACYLWFRGHRIVEKKWERRLCTWWFEDSDALQTDVQDFFQEKATVEPRRYFAKVTEFKSDMNRDRRETYVKGPH
jgi:hypothetical protein